MSGSLIVQWTIDQQVVGGGYAPVLQSAQAQPVSDAAISAADAAAMGTGMAMVAAANAQGSASTAVTQAAIATGAAGTATTQAGIATGAAGTATTQAGVATGAAGTATTQAGVATTQAGVATTQSAATAAAAAVSGRPYPSIFASQLPQGITSIAIGGTAITGATPGTYPLTFTGGDYIGMSASLVVDTATSARIVFDTMPDGRPAYGVNLSGGTTLPTVTKPSGANLPAGTTLTAVAGTLITAEIQTYWVQTTDGMLLLYGNHAGAATPAGAGTGGTFFGGTQLTALTGATLALAQGRQSFVVVDQAGNLVIQISKLQIDHPDINAIRDQALACYNTLFAPTTIPQGRSEVVFVDQAGNLVMTFSKEAIDHPVVDDILNRLASLEARVTPDWSAADIVAELSHIIGYGQSLMEGDYATPAISTATRAYARMFVGGVRPEDGASGTSPAPGSVYASLIAMAEAAGGRNSSGETPLSGCVDMIAQLLLAENGIDLTQAGMLKMLGSNAAMGGKSQAQLSSGSTYWTDWQNHVSYGKAAADALGVSYSPIAAIHNQGEADYNAGTPKLAWKVGQRSMRSAMEAYAQSVCGNNRPLPMIMAQTMTHLAAGKTVPTIALAQEELAVSDQWFATFPIHFMSYAPDNLHVTNISQRWQGAYDGLIIKRWLVDKIKLPTLAPTRIDRLGSSVILTFPVQPGRKLVWDTTTVADPGNYGFTATDQYGNALTLNTPVIVGPNKVRLSATSGTIGRVRCGWIGTAYKGVTCLRDDSPLIFDPSGINKPMFQWAPIFERVI